MIILFILLPLILIVIGMSLTANGMEKIAKESKEVKTYNMQKRFYAAHPKASKNDFLTWYLAELKAGRDPYQKRW